MKVIVVATLSLEVDPDDFKEDETDPTPTAKAVMDKIKEDIEEDLGSFCQNYDPSFDDALVTEAKE